MLKHKVSLIGEGEAMDPPPKKSNTADMASNQALEASANVKGEGKYIKVGWADMSIFTTRRKRVE